MTASLQIAEDLALPLDAVTQTFAVLAKRGAGKTYTAAVFAEELLKAGQQVVILDPLDVWWGLRASADGEHKGLPITVLGGTHGDLPLEASAGAVIADLLVEEGIPAVLSLRHLSKNDQRRFVTDCCERLYHRKGEPAHQQPLQVIIDEADAFVPQRVYAGQERMVGAIDDLVRRGRSSGIGVTLITQRAAVIHKDVLTQIEVLVALRTISPQDRRAVEEWIEAHDAEGRRQEFMASLASLPIGTAWVWSPGWLEVFRRVQIRRRETFDSSATPKAGQRVKTPQRLADVDLAKLQERLANAVERAKELDPQALRRRIADLERQLRERPAVTKVEPKLERLEVPVLTDEHLSALRDATRQAQEAASALGQAAERIAGALQAAQRGPVAPRAAPHERASTPAEAPPAPRPARRVEGRPATGELSRPQQRILDALASFEVLGLSDVAKGNVAVWSDQSPRSSAFGNNLGALRTAGLVDYPSPGRVRLTDAGRQRATPADQITDLRHLHDAWAGKLSHPQSRILYRLLERYPEAVERDALARLAEQSPTSSAYGNNLGALRSLGLISYPERGWVAATDLLFPPQLTPSASSASRAMP